MKAAYWSALAISGGQPPRGLFPALFNFIRSSPLAGSFRRIRSQVWEGRELSVEDVRPPGWARLPRAPPVTLPPPPSTRRAQGRGDGPVAELEGDEERTKLFTELPWKDSLF